MHRIARHVALPVAVVALALLAGCGGSSTSGTSAGGSRTASGGKAASSAAAPDSAASAAKGTTALTAGDVRSAEAADNRALVRTAQLTVQVSDVPSAVRQAEALAVDAGGLVSAEQTSDDPGAPRGSHSDLTLQVPPAAYAVTLDRLAALGTRLDQTQSTEDVTTKVVDVKARIEAQQASVARVQALLSRAKTLGDVVQIEGELTRRQADLESLESQQKALAAQTDLATIQLTLQRSTVAATTASSHLGFLTGLRNGWDAFVAVVLVALTVVGVALPFVVAIGLVAVLAWRVVVASRRRGAPPAAPPADAV